MLIARLQPDNNIETIITGVVESNSTLPLLIVGDYNNKYGRYLKKKYRDNRIVFLDKNFNETDLNNLRYFSSLYFHGHSAGGTKSSLLEAMATSRTVCAHNNEFNKSVLGDEALYFKDKNDISRFLNNETVRELKTEWIENNLNKLKNSYNMDYIINKYQKLL